MLLELGIILVLVLVNGLFAGMEIAVVGLERARVASLVEEGRRGAKAIHSLRAKPERFFATIQIGITIVGATAGAFGGATLARDLSPLLVPWMGAYAHQASIAIVIVTISYFSLVLGELVPKSLALRRAESYALAVAPVLLSLSTIARPFVTFLTWSSNCVLRIFGDRTTFVETKLSPEELSHLVGEAAESGTLDAQVGDIAARAIDFAKLKAEHVMIPRTQVIGVPRDASLETLREIVLEHGHSRLPVFDHDLDTIVGYVLYKDLLSIAWQGQLVILEDLLRSPLVVAEQTPASEVLTRMREERSHLAVVIDERGGVAGIVTLDDVIEELVGDVFGELHRDEPEPISSEADGSIRVNADVAIREVNRQLDVELPEGNGFTTIGGLCMYLAGDVPEAGTVLHAEDGTEIVVVSASDRVVKVVRVVRHRE